MKKGDNPGKEWKKSLWRNSWFFGLYCKGRKLCGKGKFNCYCIILLFTWRIAAGSIQKWFYHSQIEYWRWWSEWRVNAAYPWNRPWRQFLNVFSYCISPSTCLNQFLARVLEGVVGLRGSATYPWNQPWRQFYNFLSIAYLCLLVRISFVTIHCRNILVTMGWILMKLGGSVGT